MFISYSPVLRGQYESDEKFSEVLEQAQELVMQSVRQERDKHLAASDWTQFDNSPLSAEAKSAWAAYRQALRDITQEPINWGTEFVIDDSYFPPKPETT